MMKDKSQLIEKLESALEKQQDGIIVCCLTTPITCYHYAALMMYLT